VEVCGHFENDPISTLRTTRSRFENDSISHPADTPHEFRLDFFAEFSAQKKSGGSKQLFTPSTRQPLLDVVPRQHLLVQLPAFALRDDVAGVAQIERVGPGAAVGVLFNSSSSLTEDLTLDPSDLLDWHSTSKVKPR